MQYIRERTALPITRDYMAEAEQRYRKIGAATAPAKRAAAKRAPAKRRGAQTAEYAK